MLETNEELCTRWIEVGAYYPFSRNHNTKKQPAQELYLWGTVTEAARKALTLRYMLLPYMYTLFAEAHYHGTPVVRALWFNFPNDAQALAIDGQFMLGASVLITPVLTAGMEVVKAYFPEGLWYPVSAGVLENSVVPLVSPSGGRTAMLHTPLTDTNVHVRGGSILPLQQAANTTTQGRLTPFTLLISLSGPSGVAHGMTASGALFWDDGDQLEVGDNYLHVHYSAEVAALGYHGRVFNKFIHNEYTGADELVVDTLIINGLGLNCPQNPSKVSVDNAGSPTVLALANQVCRTKASTNNLNQEELFNQLVFSNLSIGLRKEFSITW
jgi:alpha-glucosidase (family GH31 glycosyl hydrolase)